MRTLGLVLCLAACQQAARAALVVKEPPAPSPLARDTEPTTHWLEQPLDHFHPQNNQTWNMRYMYSPDLVRDDPVTAVLILVGGEWTISPGWLQGGLMYEIAEQLGAPMFYTEHRYYGQSRPTEDISTDNLRYLNVDQSLADLAYFIEHVHAMEGGRYRDALVGLVGCSYAGSMVTWARATYPHLVDAAFSSSGPLHAQEDFPEYLEVINEALEDQGGAACLQAVRDGVQEVEQLLETDEGVATVSQWFNTCSQLNTSESLDVQTFWWYGVTESFAALVQRAVPGDIETACAQLNATATGSPAQRLAAWVTTMYSWSCLQTDYDLVVASHSNTSYDGPDSVMRLWTYQTCVEYGWYQTTNSAAQPFSTVVPLEYFHTQCKDFFGDSFDEEVMRFGIQRTNLFQGSLNGIPPNVISVQGGADPWYPMGPTEAAGAMSPVVVVPRTSHCRSLQAVAASETDALRTAKNRVIDYIIEWLTPNSACAHMSSVLVLSISAFAVIFNLF